VPTEVLAEHHRRLGDAHPRGHGWRTPCTGCTRWTAWWLPARTYQSAGLL